MKTIANYLYAIAISGIYKKDDWQKWADNQILKNNTVEEWVYNVSLARDIDELSKALSNKIIDEDYYKHNESAPSDAIIGYFYIDYLAGNISLYELLSKSGSEADSGGEAMLECELFYSILNDIDKNEKLLKDKGFQKRITDMFEPFKEIAQQQKKHLEEYWEKNSFTRIIYITLKWITRQTGSNPGLFYAQNTV